LLDALPEGEKPAFKKATLALMLAIDWETGDDERKADSAILQRFNGKSVAEIVADYEGLPPDLRSKLDAAVAEVTRNR